MTPPRRFPAGPVVAALGAVLILVSLFLDWYEEYTAWTVFEVLDLLLAAVAIAALVALLGELGVLPGGRRKAPAAGELLPLGIGALVLVVSQLLNHPPAADDFDKGFGIWLALAGSIVMLAGAVLASARISLALDVEPRGSEPPDAPTVPQPEAPEAGTAPQHKRPEGPPP